jgi:hypothetical protein
MKIRSMPFIGSVMQITISRIVHGGLFLMPAREAFTPVGADWFLPRH